MLLSLIFIWFFALAFCFSFGTVSHLDTHTLARTQSYRYRFRIHRSVKTNANPRIRMRIRAESRRIRRDDSVRRHGMVSARYGAPRVRLATKQFVRAAAATSWPGKKSSPCQCCQIGRKIYLIISADCMKDLSYYTSERLEIRYEEP